MKSTITWFIIILIILIGGYLILTPSIPTEEGPIKIGAVLSLTGDAASYGEMAKKGIDLAIDEINKEGEKIKVIIEDDKTSPKDGVSAMKKLINIDEVYGVIGGLWDFTAQPLIPLALENKTTFISPSNFRIEGSFELNNESFVMLTDFENVIRELKKYIEKEEINNLAVVRFASDFGKEISDTLSEIMIELEREAVVEEVYNEIGSGDFRTVITKLKGDKIETVFLDMIDFDAVNFVKQAKELKFEPKIITYTMILDALEKVDIDKELLEGIVVLNWEVVPDKFRKIFEEKYNIKPTKSADKAYNAVYVLYEALSKKGDMSTSGYIEKNNFGDIRFTENHTVDNVMVEVGTIKNREFVKYEPGE